MRFPLWREPWLPIFRAFWAYPEGWQEKSYNNPDAVQIMTVHQAKGMQWPAVFIPALLRNRFPAKKPGGRNVWHLLPREGVKKQCRYEGMVEDERRLFYVALTRSQKFLYLTYGIHPDNQLYRRPSEFWEFVLRSKFVKRHRPDYSNRIRREPRPKKGVTNVTFSFSDIKYFFECPYRFKLQVLCGFNAPIAPALGYGKSLHDMLADVHGQAIDGCIVGQTAVDHLVNTHLHMPYASSRLAEDLRTSAIRVVRKYLEDNKELLTQVEYSEKEVEIHLENGVTIRGRIDLVRRLDNDEITIVDLKSNDRAQAEETTEVQLHTYALGYEELTGQPADFVETYELDDGRRIPRAVDGAFIEDVKSRTQEAARALGSGTFEPRPDAKKCSVCDTRALCSARTSVSSRAP